VNAIKQCESVVLMQEMDFLVNSEGYTLVLAKFILIFLNTKSKTITIIVFFRFGYFGGIGREG